MEHASDGRDETLQTLAVAALSHNKQLQGP